MSTTAPPDIARSVGVCMSCEHWQCDVTHRAVKDLGGFNGAAWALGEAAVEHLTDCPGAGGRVKAFGQWVEPIKMANGELATGSLMMVPLPRWWVTR